MRVSVVIASKDRSALLATVLNDLRPQVATFDGEAEIIVVDDGSSQPYDAGVLDVSRVVRTVGLGPARARNAGVRAATGDIIVFTDDDVRLDPQWLVEAMRYFDQHPDHAGVTGETVSPPYDPLFEHSVRDGDGGSYLTCNVAYRREALVAVGGFDRLFPHAAHEDRDLAWRVMNDVGPVGFVPTMRVTHPGRKFTLRQGWRRAELTLDDWLLLTRWPEHKASRHSTRWAPFFNAADTWRQRWTWRHPLRRLLLAGGQLLVIAWLSTTKWHAVANRDVRPVPGLRFDGPRVAYVGPSPDPGADGAPGVAGLLLRELLGRGVSFDCFVVASVEDDDPCALGTREGLSYVIERSRFRFMRWYSRTRVTKMVSSQFFAARGRKHLARRLEALHRASPYDLVYQFSTFESFGVPRVEGLPVLSHPSVHAAGERRWFLREGRAGLSSDPRWRRFLVATWLGLRVARQRRDARHLDGLFALSRSFGNAIVSDYGVASARVRVVPNCVDLERFALVEPSDTHGLVAVGRLAVRKGWEQLVALSHERDVDIRVLGAPSLWSDYSRLFSSAASNLVVEGSRSRDEVARAIAGSHGLAQLSRYEPFGLTVAEALAVGRPVIVTPAVGAAEELSDAVAWRVAPTERGAGEDLLSAVRDLEALTLTERVALAHRCRAEAERLFAPAVVAEQWLAGVSALLGR